MRQTRNLRSLVVNLRRNLRSFAPTSKESKSKITNIKRKAKRVVNAVNDEVKENNTEFMNPDINCKVRQKKQASVHSDDTLPKRILRQIPIVNGNNTNKQEKNTLDLKCKFLRKNSNDGPKKDEIPANKKIANVLDSKISRVEIEEENPHEENANPMNIGKNYEAKKKERISIQSDNVLPKRILRRIPILNKENKNLRNNKSAKDKVPIDNKFVNSLGCNISSIELQRESPTFENNACSMDLEVHEKKQISVQSNDILHKRNLRQIPTRNKNNIIKKENNNLGVQHRFPKRNLNSLSEKDKVSANNEMVNPLDNKTSRADIKGKYPSKSRCPIYNNISTIKPMLTCNKLNVYDISFEDSFDDKENCVAKKSKKTRAKRCKPKSKPKIPKFLKLKNIFPVEIKMSSDVHVQSIKKPDLPVVHTNHLPVCLSKSPVKLPMDAVDENPNAVSDCPTEFYSALEQPFSMENVQKTPEKGAIVKSVQTSIKSTRNNNDLLGEFMSSFFAPFDEEPKLASTPNVSVKPNVTRRVPTKAILSKMSELTVIPHIGSHNNQFFDTTAESILEVVDDKLSGDETELFCSPHKKGKNKKHFNERYAASLKNVAKDNFSSIKPSVTNKTGIFAVDIGSDNLNCVNEDSNIDDDDDIDLFRTPAAVVQWGIEGKLSSFVSKCNRSPIKGNLCKLQKSYQSPALSRRHIRKKEPKKTAAEIRIDKFAEEMNEHFSELESLELCIE